MLVSLKSQVSNSIRNFPWIGDVAGAFTAAGLLSEATILPFRVFIAASLASALNASHFSRSKPFICMKPKLDRRMPAGRFNAINTASIARVPLPHIGFTKFLLPFHPLACITPAASVSCIGALSGIFL